MGCQSDVKIGDNLTFTVVTHDPDSGVVTDAAAVPDYWVYEDENGTAILSGSMAKLDDANTTGHYSELLACTSGNGFEDGKSYSIYIEATVDGDKGAIGYNFVAHDHDCTDIQDDLDSDSVVVASVTGAAGSVTGAVGSVTGSVGGNVDGSVGSVTGAVGSVTGNVGGSTASVVGAVGSVAGNVDGSVASVTGAVGSVTGAVGSVGAGGIDAAAIAADAVTELRCLASGTSDSGSTSTMVDAALTQANDYWNGCWILFTAGNADNQVRLITDFDAGTDTITFAPVTTGAVDTETYEILPAGAIGSVQGNVTGSVGSVSGAVGSVAGNVDGSVASVAGNVDGSTASVSGAVGSVTGAVGSVTGSVGGNVDGSTASVTGAVGSVTGAVGSVAGNVDGSVASVSGAVGGNVTGSVGDLTATAVNKIWDDLTSGLTQAGSIGKLIVDTAAAAALEATLTAMQGGTFNEATDSLEAIRNRGDVAWITGGAGSASIDCFVSIPALIDLANTATVRLAIHLIDQTDDLPTTGEITAGTISIDRKGRAGTTWSSVVSDAACSESAGVVYYDEVFDSGTGYALGDTVRITFKSQKVTISGNDHEIIPGGGAIFYARVTALNDVASAGGSGANVVTISVEDANTAPLSGVVCYVSADAGSTWEFDRTTDTNGEAEFMLDDATYKLRCVRSNYSHTDEDLVVSGATDLTATMTAFDAGTPSASYCRVHGWLREVELGTAIRDQRIHVRLITQPHADAAGVYYDDDNSQDAPDAEGYWFIDTLQGATVRYCSVRISDGAETHAIDKTVLIPASSSATLESLDAVTIS